MAMPRHILLPLIIASAMFMETMDSTIIATSLPAIAAGLGEHPLSLNLGLTAYLVSLAVFIPVSGWVADRVGARTVFIAAILVFVTGSVLCATVHSLGAFVVARFFQGIGGAMMVPVGRMVILKSVPKSDLVVALNYLTIPALLGPVVGPALGGAIVLYFDWRGIFLVNVPMGLIALLLALRFVPNYKEDKVRPLDVRGFILSGTGLACIMLGVSTLGRHLLETRTAIALVVVGLVALALYARHAYRVPHPLLDLRLLRLPTVSVGIVGGSLFRVGSGALPFLVPLMLQLGFGLNPLQSGLISCFGAIGSMSMRTMTVQILRRFGFRAVVTGNALLASASIASFGLFTAESPHFLIVAALLLSGCLRSIQFTCLNAISFDVDKRHINDTAAMSSMMQRLSQSVGVTLAALVLQFVTTMDHRDTVQAEDFGPTFLFIGLLSALSLLWVRRLPPDAGAELSGHRRKEAK